MTQLPFPLDAKVLVFGLGLQGGGEGDVRYLLSHGYQVRITDKKTAPELAETLARLPNDLVGTFGSHSLNDIEWADYILVNPGVPTNIPELIHATKLGKPLVNRTALFVKNAGIPVIGITGTRGKSTTTELAYRLLDAIYPGLIVRGGNTPGISDLELLDQVDQKKYAVMELSSFQLEHFHVSKISPQYAIITNLYPDHLNRYPDMHAYALAKSAICAYQQPSDITLFNADNPACKEIAGPCSGQLIAYSASSVKKGAYPHLQGLHNQENMAGVLTLAGVLGIDPPQVYNLFTTYPGLPFRFETRGIINGITYINDTTATTPTATEKALATLHSPTILILGGAEKGLPTDNLFRALAASPYVTKIVILGSVTNQPLNAAVSTILQDKVVGRALTMSEAVAMATSQAKLGDLVLLSPAHSSFDLFRNEFDRGRQFNDAVEQLKRDNYKG